MERKDRGDYAKEMTLMAQKTFTDHRIPFCNLAANQLTLKKPGTGFYVTHLTLYRGTLCVFGDIDTVVFAQYSGDTIKGATGWMGNAELTYAMEKAARGIGVSRTESILSHFEPDVAVDDVLSYIDDLEPDDPDRVSLLKVLQDEINCFGGTSAQELHKALYDADYDLELVGKVGMVPAPRVFYARQACKTAYELLKRDG